MKFLRLLCLAMSLSASPGLAAKPYTYKLDASKSKVEWTGKKISGEHHGHLNFKDGKIIASGKKLVGGQFSVDMTSLKDDDLTDSTYNSKLVNHLRSDDFFSIDKNPTSSFVIKKVTELNGNQEGFTHQIEGDLNIKGIVNPISFPAKIKTDKNVLLAEGKIDVDRTKWNIKFRSASFFKDLGDKVIDDKFSVNLNIYAKK
jgi:polyisoprenoid-binding protein YceI